MPTLLHISDLHRTSEPRLRNDELFSAIVSDADRWELEGIPQPDLIVVSGDLIQGVAPNTLDADYTLEDADSEIKNQYREASEFLISLAQKFTNSDRSKVIIVPGNHDVHWARAFDAMKPLDDCPPKISTKSLEATSNVRWNWKDQKAYEIFDESVYASRLEHFREFQRDFYKGLENNLLLKVNGDRVFARYPDLGLVIAGFASWYGNDCFCHVGDIDSSILSESRKLL
ncbi:MAG: metallophosphoesterase, partial [Candidatus Dadabacteria bacterium]|nr:metallophosphoesterase [Candidatus Dadabacteria bacterium]